MPPSLPTNSFLCLTSSLSHLPLVSHSLTLCFTPFLFLYCPPIPLYLLISLFFFSLLVCTSCIFHFFYSLNHSILSSVRNPQPSIQFHLFPPWLLQVIFTNFHNATLTIHYHHYHYYAHVVDSIILYTYHHHYRHHQPARLKSPAPDAFLPL